MNILLVLSLSVAANAGTMSSDRTDLPLPTIVSALEKGTGLIFEPKCSTCTSHGKIERAGSLIEITLYEAGEANKYTRAIRVPKADAPKIWTKIRRILNRL